MNDGLTGGDIVICGVVYSAVELVTAVELTCDVDVGFGTKTGPVPEGTIKVATMVECVSGAALVCPIHMP